MVNKPESAFGGGPEASVGGIVVPESLQKQSENLQKAVDGRAKKIKALNNPPVSDLANVRNEYDDFRADKRIKEIRAETVDILSKTPNFVADVAARSQNFYSIVDEQKLTWKQTVNNPELVAIVKETTAREKAALTPASQIIIPEGYKSRGQPEMSLDERSGGDFQLKKDGTIEDRFILRSEGSVKEGASKEGAVDFVAYGKKDFGTIGQEYQNSVGKVTGAPEQKGALSAENIDINLDISKATIDAQKAEADVLIARLEARNAAKKQEGVSGSILGSEITINNFTAEEQAKKKAEWLRDNPQESGLDIDLAQMEKDASQKPRTPQNVDINLTTLEDEAIERQRKLLANAPKDSDARMILIPGRNLEQNQALEGAFAASVAAAPERMEQISQVLEKRKNKSKENLEKMGASWLSKSLEAFKGISPKYKIALGVTLAGASVASGGLTAIVGIGVMKGLASLSYGSAIYDTMLKAKQEGGFEVNKSALAINSIVLGIGAALATSWIVSEVFSHVDVPKSLEGVKGMVKSWFSSLHEITPLPTSQLEAMPIKELSTDGGLKMNSDVSLAESLSSTTESIATPSTSPLAAYTIQSGDNLTKIIHEQVLKTIPGVENLDDFQKNNIIANLLQQAKENPTSSLYATINQFSNPNVIQPDKILDLNEIRQAITEQRHNLFGGTLLYHAKTITGGGFAGGGYTSSPSLGSVGVEDSTTYSSGKDTEDVGNLGSNSATPAETQPLVQQNSTPAPQENGRIRGKGYLTNA